MDHIDMEGISIKRSRLYLKTTCHIKETAKREDKNSSSDSGAQKNQIFKPKSNSSNVGEILDVFLSKKTFEFIYVCALEAVKKFFLCR